MSDQKPSDWAHQLTRQSLTDKFESPFDLVLYAIQRAQEQIALQISGSTPPSDNVAQKILAEISEGAQKRIDPVFEKVDFTKVPETLTGQTRGDARRVSNRKKKRALTPGQQ